MSGFVTFGFVGSVIGRYDIYDLTHLETPLNSAALVIKGRGWVRWVKDLDISVLLRGISARAVTCRKLLELPVVEESERGISEKRRVEQK